MPRLGHAYCDSVLYTVQDPTTKNMLIAAKRPPQHVCSKHPQAILDVLGGYFVDMHVWQLVAHGQ